jgi:hypothetical protein
MTMNNDDRPSFFAQYIDSPAEGIRRDSPAQKLLDWLQHDWTGSTITARDIYHFGPNSSRDRESAISLAEILVAHGRLIPIETRRVDMKKWQIVRCKQMSAPRGP